MPGRGLNQNNSDNMWRFCDITGRNRPVLSLHHRTLTTTYNSSPVLSHDQKCGDLTERARIMSAGGFVRPRPAPDLSARVYTDAELTKV